MSRKYKAVMTEAEAREKAEERKELVRAVKKTAIQALVWGGITLLVGAGGKACIGMIQDNKKGR